MNYFSQKLTLKDSGITWIREIPKHWNVGILNNLVQIIVSNVDKKNNEAEIKVLLCNYTDVYYKRFINSTIYFMEATATKLEVAKFSLEINDVLITKDSETPDDIAVPSLVIEKIPNLLCGYHLSILRPLIDRLDGKYLLFSIISTSIKSQFSSLATGITRYGLSYKHIKSINLCVPPLEEQRSIASFLDRKTAAIDTLIAKKQRLIQLLKEKRTALINQAVTKGLHPNVPMKDSRIPWIGYIPEHWKIMRLKFLTSRVTSGSRGWAQYYSEQGAIFIRINNLSRKSIELNLKDIQYVQPPLDAEGERSRVQLGDLLISVTAYIGTVGVVTQDLGEAYVNQHIALTRPRQDLLNPQWLGLYLFASPGQNQFNALLDGSTKDGLALEDIKNLLALVPPRKEQLELVDLLSLQISRTAKLINTVSEQIKKLQEYRQSLITAAVTGKIDIREEVAA